MYLQRLELQGFKSFANRTELEFLGPQAGSKGITAIVGPNGSGKSNVADGIRWALGEQSMKLLRGKKSEDVIYSGTAKRARSGFAEVTMLLNNDDRFTAVDFPEILITRRLYRDGQSEYLLNKKKVRLADIQLLLAQASFGERHYSVIGQGMIEGLLQLTPEERREFFEEAAGVKSLELKKRQSLGKLELAETNLRQAEALVKEIEPRQRSLSRQVKKLEERSNLEAELHGLQHAYYSLLWRGLSGELGAARDQQKTIEERWKKKKEEVTIIEKELGTIEQQETRSEQFLKMQKEYQILLDQRNALREKEFDIRTMLERSKGASVATLPVATIIQELRGIREEAVKGIIEKIIERIEILIGRLEQPTKGGADPKLAKDLQKTVADLTDVGKKLADLQARIEQSGKEEAGRKSAFFEAQRRIQSKQEELYAIDRELSEAKVEVAKLETRREGLEHEMANELKERVERVKQEAARRDTPAPTAAGPLSSDDSSARIQKLKYQLELIGGIDPEVMKEFSETNDRYQTLKTESEDLRKSITDLEQVIIELNRSIETQFTETFQKIRDNFERYFKILFGGGSAKLERKKIEPVASVPEGTEAGESVEHDETKPATLSEKFAAASYEIEINASPPGKRIKSINVLSGGERALTAIALISAIIAVNPSPFVVLDEVDAALDENNSIRFSEIIRELSSKSQFIVITHNRYTMEHSSTLYGVTMKDDGTSQLLSVKLDEAVK